MVELSHSSFKSKYQISHKSEQSLKATMHLERATRENEDNTRLTKR